MLFWTCIAVIAFASESDARAQSTPLPHASSDDVVIPVLRDFLTIPEPGEDFGVCVSRGRDSSMRDVIVVGAARDEDPGDPGQNYGSVHVYVRGAVGWELLQILRASDRAPDDNFGRRVDIDGDTLVVSAYMFTRPSTLPGPGRVYVFQVRPDGLWYETAVIPNPLPATSADGSLFGCALALEGERIVVGATHVASLTGKAWVFERSGPDWSSYTTH
jgi:hypothetical protein